MIEDNVRITLRIPSGVYEHVKQHSSYERKSINSYIVDTLVQQIKNDKKEYAKAMFVFGDDKISDIEILFLHSIKKHAKSIGIDPEEMYMQILSSVKNGLIQRRNQHFTVQSENRQNREEPPIE